jgi:hypothetical protein
MAHAFFTVGDLEEGIARAQAFVGETLGLNPTDIANVTVNRYTNFDIDDVRDLITATQHAPTHGAERAVLISASRLFVPAQNAMLKLFEEPPEGMTLVLVVPSEGVLLPTLRSRLIRLPDGNAGGVGTGAAFLALSATERKQLVDKLLDRARSEKPGEKREARREALELVQDITRTLYLHEGIMKESVLGDLSRAVRTLHDISAPLKPIFEHLLIVLPEGKALPKARV